MKVNQLVIQNFRGIEDLTLDFGDRNLIVLIGINGSGKSSILDCLAILLCRLTGSVENNVGSSLRINHNFYLKKQDIKNHQDRSFAQIKIELYQSQLCEWSLSQAHENNTFFGDEVQQSMLWLGAFA